MEQSLIINPNEPKPKRPPQSMIQTIIDTMRVISNYRSLFFDLEAAKSNEGVTASDIIKLSDKQQDYMQEMVTFILYGKS